MEQNKYYTIYLSDEERQVILTALARHIQGLENTHGYQSVRHDHKYAAQTLKSIEFCSKLREQFVCAPEVTNNPWHSVKDQLPTITDGESADILAVDEYGNQGVAWLRLYSNGTTEWWSCDDRLEKRAITAWRELEPYEAKEQ